MFIKGQEEVEIKESDKTELLLTYEHSRGMSGISPKDINNIYIVDGYYGSNLSLKSKDTHVIPPSLSHTRFQSVS